MTISAILLHPGNRLLHGGTADLSTFGGQPAAVSVGQARLGDGGYIAAFADRDASEPSGREDAAAPSLYAAPSPGSGSDSAAGPLSHAPLSMPFGPGLPSVGLQAGANTVAPFASSNAPLLPLGSVPPAEGAQAQAPAAEASGLTANAFHAPVLDSVAPTLAPEVLGLTSGLAAASLNPVLALAASTPSGAVASTLQAVDTVEQIGAAAVQDLAAAADQVATTAETLVGTTAPVVATVDQAVAPVTDSAASLVDQAVTPLAATAADAIAPVAELAASATEQIAETTGATTEALLGAAGDSLTSTVVPLVDKLAAGDAPAAAAEAASMAQQAVATTAASTDALLGGTGDSVTATVMPLVDHLAASDAPTAVAEDVLGGVDPAAGIATLTAMVGSADVFELTSGTVDTTIDTAASALDAVPLDGEAATPLLGEEGVTDDLLHHDDSPIGIGGL